MNNPAYDWDFFRTYNLTQASLEKYLREKYGPWDFYIQVVYLIP
jgi:hypothetical protein